MRVPKNITHEKKEYAEVVHITPAVVDVTRLHLTVRLQDIQRDNSMLLPFFADMLERGSKAYTKQEYEEKLEFYGAQVEVEGAGDMLEISITARTTSVPEVLRIVERTLRAPRFLKGEIAKLKKEIGQTFTEEKNDTNFLALALFSRQLYTEKDPAYIPDVAVRKKHLARVSAPDLRRVHALFLHAPWYVSVSASLDIKKKVLALCSRLHAQKTLPYMQPQPHTSLVVGETISEYTPGKQNIEFFMGNRLPLTLKDADFIPFAFGLDVLGKRGGFAGRLMSTVREKEGLTYTIYAWIRGATTSTHGHWNIWTFFTPKDAKKGIASTMREIKHIVTKGITTAELVRFKELLKNQFGLAHESVASTLALYHSALVAGRTPDDVHIAVAKRDVLTKKEVNDALKKYLKPTHIVIAGAGPTKELSQ